MIWGKLPALFVSCDQAHKISKCPALTLSKIHYNLAFNIHLNKQKYFFQVSYMSRTSARSNAVPYLHCPALTLSRTDVVPHWHLQISFNFKDKIYLGVNICVTHSRKIILTELPAFFYLLNRHTSFQNVPHWQNFQNVKSCSIWLFFLLGKLMRLVLIGHTGYCYTKEDSHGFASLSDCSEHKAEAIHSALNCETCGKW